MADAIPKTKINVLFSHGLMHVNNFFIVPEGYSFIFLSKSGSSTSNSQLFYQNIITDVCTPKLRGYISSEADYYHEYLSNELIPNHTVVFEPNTGKDEFMLTGIIGKDKPKVDLAPPTGK